MLISFLALISVLVDRSHKSYYVLAKVFSFGIFKIAGIKLKTIGLENFNHDAVYIFVSNHSSLFDIPALQFSIPNKIGIVFKKELAKIPLFGWQLKLGPYIMIDRQNPEKALKSIEEARQKMINKHVSAVVFPEGTRSKTGEIQQFKRGAFYLAVKSGFPIIPVTISGTQQLLPKGKFNIKRGTVVIHFDEPITTEAVNSRADELELMQKVRNIIIGNYNRG
jgi:1-acyl-sn-glycerol-3-phosphate acyltransferase